MIEMDCTQHMQFDHVPGSCVASSITAQFAKLTQNVAHACGNFYSTMHTRLCVKTTRAVACYCMLG